MNADIHENVVMAPSSLQWVESDMPGVERALLDRVDWESSFLRANSEQTLVASGPSNGEEYLVLSGSIQYEGEQLTAGSYFRIPAGTDRALVSGSDGVLLFQKTGHFIDTDRSPVSENAHTGEWQAGLVDGLSVMSLHSHSHEGIAFVKWAPHTQFKPHVHPGGEEIIVLEGTFHDEYGGYPTGTWLRNKPYSRHTPHTDEDGALIYVKTGHLPPKEIN